jgi:hypothetical protein
MVSIQKPDLVVRWWHGAFFKSAEYAVPVPRQQAVQRISELCWHQPADPCQSPGPSQSAQNPEDRAGVLPDALSVDQQQEVQRLTICRQDHWMPVLFAIVGFVLVVATLLDAFEVVLLPRPVRRRLQVNRYFFRWAWAAWSWLASRLTVGRRREDFIGVFGPLSMVSLFGAWALLLIVGFALLHWAVPQLDTGVPLLTLSDAMVVSGDAFFTLGYGDVVPHYAGGRFLVIVEAGTGFGFIALTIAYLPVLYQHFSRRDYQLIDLSARAGTPPTAAALLEWHAAAGGSAALNQWLRDWEIWASDLTESHSAYPMLAFYRSQHTDHSWLSALAVVLDTCSLLIASSPDGGPPQASATFSAARRVLTVVAGSLEVVPLPIPDEDAEAEEKERATCALEALMPEWKRAETSDECLEQLHHEYRPAVAALSGYLLLPMNSHRAQHAEAGFMSTRERVVKRLIGDSDSNGKHD